MARVKGIVAEVAGSKCILITQDGQFLRVKKPTRAVVGEEIEAVPVSMSWGRLVPAVAAVLLLCLVIPSFMALTAAAQPVAYVSLDINPSLDLGVDRNGNVVSVNAFNQAGKELADKTPVRKMKVYDAVNGLIKQAIKDGYIDYRKSNLIVAAFTGGTAFGFDVNLLKTQLAAGIQAADIEAEIAIVTTDLNTHKQAGLNHVSQGKYSVYQAAKARGKDISLEELKGDGIKNLLLAKGMQVRDVLPGVSMLDLVASRKGAKSSAITGKSESEQPAGSSAADPSKPGTKLERGNAKDRELNDPKGANH